MKVPTSFVSKKRVFYIHKIQYQLLSMENVDGLNPGGAGRNENGSSEDLLDVKMGWPITSRQR